MSERIKYLYAPARPQTIASAIKRAKAYTRHVGTNNLQEPQGLTSGDMNKFLNDPDAYDREGEEK